MLHFIALHHFTAWRFVAILPRVSLCCAVLSCFNCVWLLATLWTVACQAPLFMGFSRQEYWSGMPFSSPGDLPDPGIESVSLMSPALAGVFFTTSRSLYTDRYLNLALICPNFHTQDNFFPFKETMYFYIYLSPKICKLQTEPSKAKSAACMCLPSLYYQCALTWQKRKLMFMWFY